MAISQTMSNPNDWIFQPNYQNNFSHLTHTDIPPPTNTFTATNSATTSAARATVLTPEQGRVSKPIRKRSRASRRTPTTLLNTDTTNFRAMVQHFTGGPAAPFAGRPEMLNRGGATISAAAGGFHVEYPNQLQQQQQHMMMMMGNMHGGGEAARGNGNGGFDNYMLG